MIKKRWVPKSQRITREIDFLARFYDPDNANYQDGKGSAIAAGYAEKTASRVAENLLEKYRGFDFKAIALAMNVDRISIGLALKKILHGSGAPRDVLSAARLLLANMGEQTDSAGSQKNITNISAPTMIITGYTHERLESLKRGSDLRLTEPKNLTPQLLAAAYEETIEVVASTAVPVEAGPATTQKKDARSLSAGDFTGESLNRKKRRYY